MTVEYWLVRYFDIIPEILLTVMLAWCSMLIPHYYAQNYAGIMWTTLEAGHKRKIPRKNYTTGSTLPSVSFALVAFLFPRIRKRQPAWSIDQALSINKSIIKYNQELSINTNLKFCKFLSTKTRQSIFQLLHAPFCFYRSDRIIT